MKKTIAILMAVLMLFSLFQGASRENVVRAVIQPIWSMFHYNVQHTGQCPYNTSNNDGTLKWRYQTGDDVRSSPAIAGDGTIYVGSHDNYLYAINPDGTLKWKHQTGDDILSSPAIAGDGTIYVGSHDNYLYAINPNGTIKWEFETGDDIWSSPAIAPDGIVYVGSEDNYLYAINPIGTLKWRYKTGYYVYSSSPAIAPDGTIYVGSNDNYLYAINPNGTLKWRYEVHSDVECSSPTIAEDGTVYVGSYDKYLYAINPNGTLKWKRLTNNVVSSSPAIAGDGTVYVGSNDHYLYAINPDDGTLKWGYSTGMFGDVRSSPAVAGDGTVYVGSYDKYLYAVNPNGTLKWRYKTGDLVSSSPAIAGDGTIYVGSNDNYLYAIGETKTAEITIILQIGNPNITINDNTKPIDEQGTKPVIKNSRTLVPVRAIVEALNGTVDWDATAKKVTVILGSTTIELWIGKSTAKVNGIDTLIDAANSKVVPEIINSRTMLPLRFVTENLGCDVQWDGTTKIITITYPKS
jgi:outer membrane protein assembly factor BamB